MTSDDFEPRCTHVVSARPATTEKFLCAIAAGKHLLHPSYIEDSFEAGRFLAEEEYEWSNMIDKCEEQYDDLYRTLAKAADVWRPRRTRSTKGRKASSSGESSANGGSRCFDGVVALLFANHDKQEGLTRILEAGGAVVCGNFEAVCSIANEGASVLDLLPSEMQGEEASITHLFVSQDFFHRRNGWGAEDVDAIRDVVEELSSQGTRFLSDDYIVDKIMFNVDLRSKSGKSFILDVDKWLNTTEPRAGSKRKAEPSREACVEEGMRTKRSSSVANAFRFLVPSWR